VELAVTAVLKDLFLPPGGNILLAVVGFAFLWRAAAMGKTLLTISMLSLYLFSTPGFGSLLSATLERHPPVTAETNLGDYWQAIVVLGGGSRPSSPEYGTEVPRSRTLERIRFAATLHKRTGLPLLVSGGRVSAGTNKSEAQLMGEILLQDYGIKPRWIESDSHTTAENAIFSHSVLNADGVDKILLVTHAMHMRRAELAFGKQGFAVKPAPTIFRSVQAASLRNWLPNAEALRVTRDAFYEHIGFVWYLFRS
jgi:uncharacterized SAM-binding protein YcdF (DUF218 family)